MAKVHDMGGIPCGKAVPRSGSEGDVFEEEWHSKALALTLAAGFLGKWNIDASRHSRESLPRDEYLTLSYYEVWLAALANLIVESGLADAGELTAPHTSAAAAARPSAVKPEKAVALLGKGSPASRTLAQTPRFQAGQAVRTHFPHGNRFVENGHTRLPVVRPGSERQNPQGAGASCSAGFKCALPG